MAKDLTNSNLDRQNILNNQYAIEAIESQIKLSGFVFEGKMIFFKEQVVDFFEVTSRTIENYLSQYSDELAANGYQVLRGERLRQLKLQIKDNHVSEIDFVNNSAAQIGIFDFRAFLNLAIN